jgi:hypothetical protein
MTPVRHYLCDPCFAVGHVRAKLNPCKRCGHQPIFIEGRSSLTNLSLFQLPLLLLWCDVCGHEVETSFEAWKAPFRKRHGRVTYARRVDLNLQPLQMVGQWNQLNGQDSTPGVLYMEPITEEERLREAGFDALRIKITEEDPGYFDWLVERIIAEAKADGGSISMEELLGLPPADDLTQ